MSSEISIDDAGRLKAASTGGDVTSGVVGAGFSRSEDGFRPWHFFVFALILLATVAVILARRASPDHLILLSLTIAAAGAAAGAFYRMLVPLVTARVMPVAVDPLNERARAAVQREKTLVLRSIKELEFDRAMGKLSQRDYDEMVTRLRSRALSLMRQLDAEGYGAMIERELQARLAAAPRPTGGKMSKPTGGPARPPCAGCGIANDPDALFCKKCGTRLQT